MRVTPARVVLVLAAIVAAGALVWLLMPQPIVVETAEPTQGRFVATVTEDGRTRVRERYVVAAPLAGRLTRVRHKAGDAVSAGETIASILPAFAPLLDPRTRREAEERVGAAEAAQERARAVVERAQVQATQAKNEFERTQALVQRGASTAQALERAELAKQVAERELRAADFQLHAAGHELSQAQALLARYEGNGESPSERWNVTAPVPGVVLRVVQESETVVAPGAPLFEIGDPRDLEVVVDVLSTDAVEMKPGAPVSIEGWGGPHALAGRIRRVEPTAFTKTSALGVEEQRVNVLIDIASPHEAWAGLGDGYRVDARITVFTLENATIIPSGALFRVGDAWHAFVVRDGRVERRELQLVRRSGRTAAVSSGIAAGERLIVYPSDRIAEGVRVAVTRGVVRGD